MCLISVQKLADVISESVYRNQFLQYSPEVCVVYVRQCCICNCVTVTIYLVYVELSVNLKKMWCVL